MQQVPNRYKGVLGEYELDFRKIEPKILASELRTRAWCAPINFVLVMEFCASDGDSK
jgi:hypothetical protein